MGALGVVKANPFADACARGGAGLEGMQIDVSTQRNLLRLSR
jgi:hypothetical protein